jgi:uncharacterized protein (TIGR00299 family) protein
MDTLAFDGRTGASGDMLLAAMLAAGADRAALAPVEDALPIRYEVGSTRRDGIAATTVTVQYTDEAAVTAGRDHAAEEPMAHGHAEGAGPTRTYEEVIDVIDRMGLPAAVAGRARATVERLGRAEAAVHDGDLAGTTFHEVGADDAIADIVGASLLLSDLAPERVVTTPVATGGGQAETNHGRYPVPTPAVVELAADADWSLRGGPVDAELLTPTGAAILAEVADGVERLPTLRIRGAGYGAGSMELSGVPNLLRAIRGAVTGRLIEEEIAVLETNVDDVAPEVLGGLQETLADAGARDVSILPATMKKSRPGHLVKVICRPADTERVARRLAEETGTLGVRQAGAGHRWVADRRIESVQLSVADTTYDVDVKIASDADGAVYDVSAEYDDALALARESDLTIREVLRRAETAWRS